MNPEYITISELNHYIKGVMDDNIFLNKVYLKGEISNFKAHTRGHLYFTLKDEGSRLNAVMFSYQANTLKFEPTDGMKVLVCGKISVYEATGAYQIYVESMEQDGLGNLYIEFEKLKKKLAAEGLFDPAKKQKIPKLPRKIGIVTASTGAAIRDILTTIKRRYPICETILFPSLVQGNDAAKDIVKKIEIANTYDIDTLIVGRGGGSIEDLWPFNEEIVAREIYNCEIPVISAVGHEIDYTISDFVADLRAATPTAAAERAVPDINELRFKVNQYEKSINSNMNNRITQYRSRLDQISNKHIFKNPESIYDIKKMHLDNFINKFNLASKSIISDNKNKLFKLENSLVLKNPEQLTKTKKDKFLINVSKLEALNPLSTLKRGYSISRIDDNRRFQIYCHIFQVLRNL